MTRAVLTRHQREYPGARANIYHNAPRLHRAFEGGFISADTHGVADHVSELLQTVHLIFL